MHHYFLNPFSSFVTDHAILAYCVLFLGVFWEGEIMLIMAGILVHLKIISFWIALPVIIIAALLKTVVGYQLGKYIHNKLPDSSVLKYFERRVLYFLPRFKEKPFWSIVISKCIYGLNNATLVFSGYVGVSFKKYLNAEIISSAVWFGTMFMLGVYFSQTALAWSHNLRNFMLTVLLFILVFFAIQKIINFLLEIFEEIGS